MNYKKIVFILVIFIFLFSVSSAYAGDVADAAVASEDTGIELTTTQNDVKTIENEKTINVTDSSEVLSASDDGETVVAKKDSEILGAGEGTYSDLRNDINNGEITKSLYRYVNGDGDSITITTNSKVIDGKGAVVDMAGSHICALTVSANDVTIKNFTFKNADCYGNGGAIYFNSGGNVINCNFTDNSASYGGAIVFNEIGTVENCNFIDNKATNDGGAVYFYGGGTLTNCNFTDNEATSGNGGTIFFNGFGTVENCNIVNNTAKYSGAIFMISGSIINCNLTDNKGDGAVFFEVEGTVRNCNFINNSAVYGTPAIWLYSGSVTNCNFINNTATEGDCGAVFFSMKGTVTNCNFTDNKAISGNGGAVYISVAGSVINCNFVNNTAKYDGGAVYIYNNNRGLTVTVTNSNFFNNKANNGGAVYFSNNYNHNSTGIVSNSNFNNNNATGNGGAVYFSDYGEVRNCNLTNNNATSGSAIYFNLNEGTKIVSDSTLLNNRANAEDLQVIKNENNITITLTGNDNLLNAIYSNADVNFTNVVYWGANGTANTNTYTPSRSNKEAGQNITVFVVDNGSTVLNDVKVTDKNGRIVLDITVGENYFINARHDTDSYYTKAEGVITNFHVNVTSQITNNRTVNLTSKSSIPKDIFGGELLFILSDGTKINATYGTNGTWWAVHTFDDYGVYQVNASYIGLDNVTVNNGTIAIVHNIFWVLNYTINGNDNDTIVLDRDYTYNSTVDYDLKDGIVINRPVTIIGNGHVLNATGLARIFNIQADNVTIENITFANGKTENSGGAIYWGGANGNVSGCSFVNNYAKFGGAAIYWLRSADSVVSNCSFEKNTARYGGGAMEYVASNGCVVSDCNFEKNSIDDDDGGAIHLLRSKYSVVSGCSFVNNRAKYDGGAIYLDECEGSVVSDCSFVKNSAEYGAAINWKWSDDGIVSGCSFEDNTASTHGGAIHWERSADSVVSDCSFVNNHAKSDGGAIYWYFSDRGVVSDCSFVKNSAERYAGALFWYSNDGAVSGCIFVNNSAPDKSVIKFYNGENHNLTVNDNIFLNNNGVAVYLVRSDSTSNADYNWFGNNATNYDTEPIAHNIEINTWLFLNATANPAAISIFESYDVLFKLYSYNSTGVSDYDNSQLYPINLTVTATNGNVDSIANLDETIKYDATGIGTGTVTAKIENAEYTIEINDMVANPLLSVGSQEVSYSNNTVIALDYNSTATGKVNITLNGKKLHYSFIDLDLNETFALGDIEVDEYDVLVEYSGDDSFISSTATGNLTVIKANSNVTSVNIEFDYEGYVVISVITEGAEGVTAEIDGNATKAVGNVIFISDLNPGNHTLTVTTIPDKNHDTVTKTFNISTGYIKKDTPISANADVNGYKVTVTVEVNENATGFVNMKFGDTEFNVELSDGIGSLVVDLPANSYNVDVTYLGDDYFNENMTKLTFTVTDPVKQNTPIGLDVSSVENNATFTVTLNPDATGIVRFEVTGAEEYIVYADVLNGKAVMEDVLSVGDYEVVATYMGDSRFNSNITSGSFTIKGHVKKDTPISADAKVNGNVVTITVNVDKDATGFVGLKQAGSTIYVAVENGLANYVNKFDSGSYNVEVTYLGDDDYNENSTGLQFTVVEVTKENTTISVDVSSVEDYATFTVNVDSDATGIVKFEVTGAEEYTVYADVLNGKAVMEDVLSVGDYTVVATYMGDDRFNSNVTSKNFNIKGHVKIDTPISADVNVNGYRVTVTVEVNESATGFVNMRFGDTEFNVELNNGVGSLTVELPANSYNVDVTYLGDDNFNENMTKLTFTVTDPVKENTPIELDVISSENNVTYIVNVDPDATGIVRFEVSGAEEYTVYADVLNGKAVMEDVLSVGDYEVVATFMGDARFNSNITSQSFTIKCHVKKDTPISADAKVNGNRVTITVNVNESANGFVGLKMSGTTVYVAVENGVATYVATFAPGSYNVVATYLGDEDYNENSTRLLFTVVEVAKENTPIELDVSSTENNVTYTVNVDSDASGIVRFEVSGAEEYTVYADVLNGKAVLEDVLSVGDYTVVATYMGDDRFNSNVTSKNFNIKGHVKIDTPISANVNVNGYRVTVTVEVNESATGFVNMKFGDTEFNVELNNGVGSLTVELPANSYNVDVTYLGDDNFNENMTKLTFTVVDPVKENTPISLDVSSVEGNVTFTVIVDPDATGIVRFVVSGAEEYTVYADVLNGKAVMEDVLSVGDYTVVATYMGDSRFNSNVTSGSFTINGHVKKDTPISADAKVTGNRVTITVSVDANATGFVGLKMSGSTIYVAVENGVAKYANTFEAGSYNVAVTYLGDEDYNENSTRVLFTVVDAAKENTLIGLNVSSVEDYVTFTVTVDSGATGIVRFEVSGAEEYTVYADVLNGIAVMEDVLSVGNYTVVATYVGDENFNSNTTFAAFVVEKEPVIIPIASEFSDITIGDDLSINIVLKDENGNVIANAPITYVINGTAGTTTAAADGSFTIKGVNGAKVEIKYAGNETILPTNLTLTFNVPDVPVVVKTDTHFNISGNAITINGYAVDTKAGEKGIPYATELLDANGKPIEGAKIQFGVNNKIYKRTTNENGSFTPYNLDMIRAGRYTMAFSFGGDDNYNSTFAVVCVDLDKKPITIKASAKTYKTSTKTKQYTVTLKTIVGSSADGKVYLKSGKKVTLQVNGKTFSGKTNSKGQVTFKITNLNKKAKYKAKISYAGDITYEAATKTVTLTVK